MTTTTDPATEANEWLMSGGARSATFAEKGAHVVGFISQPPQKLQQIDFTTKAPKFWPNSPEPMYHVRVILQTEERDPADEEDTGERAIYVKGNLQKALKQAIRAAGAMGLEMGARLYVEYTGDEKPKQRGLNGAKLYTAKYQPPEALAVDVDPAEIPF